MVTATKVSQHVPLVECVWNDAWQDDDNFTSIHGAQLTHKAMIVQTIGWLIIDNEVGVRIANERSSDEGGDVYRGITFVPRAMVKSVTPFTLTRQRKPRVKAGASTDGTHRIQNGQLDHNGPVGERPPELSGGSGTVADS